MRSRQERVQRTIAANPKASNRKIADIAGVSYQAVNNYKQKLDNVLSSEKPVQLKGLYDPQENYWSHRRVHDVTLALGRCSPAEAAFLYNKGLGVLSHSFMERINHDREASQLHPATGTSNEDQVAYGAE
jgi:hypothetical protein